MINREELRAKALVLGTSSNPGLKSGVTDNASFVDFSPKYVLLLNAESSGFRNV